MRVPPRGGEDPVVFLQVSILLFTGSTGVPRQCFRGSRFKRLNKKVSLAWGKYEPAVGPVLQALLARVLGLDHFERFWCSVPDGWAEGERVFGEDGVGGGGDVVVFGGGDG